MVEALEGFEIRMKERARWDYRIDGLRFAFQSCFSAKAKPPKTPALLRDEFGNS